MSKKAIITFEGKEYQIIGFRRPVKGDNILNKDGAVVTIQSRWLGNVERTIVKPSRWVPKIGEKYFTPILVVNGNINNYYNRHVWKGGEQDYVMLNSSYICKTKTSALELREKILKTAEDFQTQG